MPVDSVYFYSIETGRDFVSPGCELPDMGTWVLETKHGPSV